MQWATPKATARVRAAMRPPGSEGEVLRGPMEVPTGLLGLPSWEISSAAEHKSPESQSIALRTPPEPQKYVK